MYEANKEGKIFRLFFLLFFLSLPFTHEQVLVVLKAKPRPGTEPTVYS